MLLSIPWRKIGFNFIKNIVFLGSKIGPNFFLKKVKNFSKNLLTTSLKGGNMIKLSPIATVEH